MVDEAFKFENALAALRVSVDRYREIFGAGDNALARLLTQINDSDALWDRRNMSGHLSASIFAFEPTMSKCIAIHHIALNRWLLPGGHCDPFETPICTALRELKEETGIGLVKIHHWHTANEQVPIHIDTHLIPARRERHEEAHYHHDFQYVGIVDAGSLDDIDVNPAEALMAKYVDMSLLRSTYGHVLPKLERLFQNP